jgi:hypothetical protein
LWKNTDWNQLAEDRVQWHSLINAETNLYKMSYLLASSQGEELCSMELVEYARLMAVDK